MKSVFMKRIPVVLLLCFFCLTAGQARAGKATWLENLPQAAEQAKAEHKLLLLDFTGSDWCGWCKKLEADTFSQPEFIDYAAKNLVLVRLDFPRQKEQPDDVKQANNELKQKYSIQGFPTIMVLKPDGTVLWKQTGYLKGGPAAMIAKLNGLNPQTTQPISSAPAIATANPSGIPIQWPAPPARKPGDEPRLQGIFYSASHPSIILEGKSCEEGDSVKGMTVLKIQRDAVTVQWNGQEKVLRLN
jgi:thioredoxin-related protein